MVPFPKTSNMQSLFIFPHLDTKRLSRSFQKNFEIFARIFMGSQYHSLPGISPVEHVIEHCQGERVVCFFHLQNLKITFRQNS